MKPNNPNQVIAVYERVSSKQQDTKSQRPDLERWLAAYAEEQPVKWYRDTFTGKTMARPGWKQLEADMEAGKVCKVICWRLDRLGRTASGLTALFDALNTRKVGLVSLKDGLDLATPAGRLMANVLASVAQYETEVRCERVLAGQAVARANGKRGAGQRRGGLSKSNPKPSKPSGGIRPKGGRLRLSLGQWVLPGLRFTACFLGGVIGLRLSTSSPSLPKPQWLLSILRLALPA